MKTIFFLMIPSLFLTASELLITQGYAQEKDSACSLSVEKALKQVSEEAIKTRCQCYRQDSRDWICYTYYQKQKKDQLWYTKTK